MRTFLFLMAAGLSLLPANAPASDSLSHGKIPIGERENAARASAEFQARHYDAAAAIYSKMAQDHPGSLYAWNNLGITRFQQGKLEEARDALQHAADLAPKDAMSHAALGITDYELRSFQDAIENLKIAISLNPDDASAHDYLGSAYESVGMKSEAKAERAIALQLEEAQVEARKQPAPNPH